MVLRTTSVRRVRYQRANTRLHLYRIAVYNGGQYLRYIAQSGVLAFRACPIPNQDCKVACTAYQLSHPLHASIAMTNGNVSCGNPRSQVRPDTLSHHSILAWQLLDGE